MPTVTCTRLVSSATSYPMSAAFLTALRAASSRSADGSVILVTGAHVFCTVDASGNWALGGTGTAYPISAETWAALRANPHPVALAFVAVTELDMARHGIAVASDPPDPIDPG